VQVLKIGGNELAEPAFLPALAEAVANLGEPVVIVHGGGKAIADMQLRLGLEPRKVEGLRVTDEPSLEVAQMVLSGQANKAIVRALLSAGVQAVGISGVDGGLLQCKKKQHPTVDLGLVGEIDEVNSTLLDTLLHSQLTPVVSPISLGHDGTLYNVNADEAAAAIATALQASTLSFISNVRAVMGKDGEEIERLTALTTGELIAQGVIRDGMVPKVQAALDVVARGVPEAIIRDLDGLRTGTGTRFVLAEQQTR
jgi:acetylglutamate kinase